MLSRKVVAALVEPPETSELSEERVMGEPVAFCEVQDRKSAAGESASFAVREASPGQH